MKRFKLLFFLLAGCLTASAQDFSNKGKEFWLAYCYHVGMVNGGGTPVMTLYLTAEAATTYTVEIYGGPVISTGPIAANQVIPVVIPNTYFINSNGLVTGRTIRVTAIKAVVVYSFITRAAASAASLALPTNVLGKEYMASSYTQISNENNASSYITIIAVEDNTSVEITPTATCNNGTWLAGNTYSVTLNKGEIFQVLGATTGNNGVDLSGTKVKSVAGASGGCKKIAVFSGSGKLSISTPGCTQSSADNLYQQLYPASSWGKKYLTVPSSARPFNYYRIYRQDPLTNVYVNGVIVPGGSFTNNFYVFSNNTPNLIEADKPVSVAQYFTTQGCAGNASPYDPEMIMLNPVEQNINRVTLVNSPLTANPPPVHQHHIHVIMKNSGTAISSFRFDGGVPAATWTVHPQDPAYSYLYLANVASGNHTLASDSGFIAAAYGYAGAESYGYSAGANVKDLYQQIGVQTQYGIEPAPSVCKGSPFRFKVSLPYCADSIRWDLSQLPGPPVPSSVLTQYTACTPGPGGPDSTTVVNGVTLYWYSLPSIYNFNVSGTFPVSMVVYKQNTDGCGNEQDIDFDLNVYDPPVADFTWTGGNCLAEPVSFLDNTVTPRPSYIWNWDFGDPPSGGNNTSGSQNPSHLFTSPGTYNVTFSTITTPGCISQQIIKQVTISPMPSATIAGATQVCVNDPSPQITFSGAGGTAPYTFYYNINGGPALSINSPAGPPAGTIATLTVPTGTPGTYTYTLDSVRNVGSAICLTPVTGQQVTVIVNAGHTATLTSGVSTTNQTVCVNNSIVPITYTLGGGATGATVTNLPPGVNAVVTGTTLTISGTPNTSIGSPFNYLVTTTGNNCVPATANGTITVTADGTISLTSPAGSDNQTICINTPLANITYAVGGSGTGGTVTGLPAGVTGVYAGGIITISGTPTVSGTFNYTVSTTGPCITPTATGTITVTADGTITLTSAPGTNNQTVCINTPITNITYAVGGTGNGGVVTGLPAGVTGVYAGGVITISGTPTVSGTFAYTVNTTGPCVTPTATGTITVTDDATVSLSSAPPTAAQELCRNSTLTNITYTTGGSATGGNVTGLPAGVTGTYAGGVITISGAPTVSGTFNYTVTATGPCASATATGTIIVNALPTSNFSFTIPSCETRTINFTDLSVPNSGNNVSWTWNFGDASPPVTINAPGSPNVSHTYAAANTYNVSLVVTTDKGCVSIEPARPVTINNKPRTGFIVPEVCINDVATVFTDTSSIVSGSLDPAGYYWDFGDPGSGAANFSTAMNGVHLYTAIGPYNVMHVSTSMAGCKDTIYQTIFINAADPVADFTIPSPTTMCSNDSVTIINRSTISQGSVTKLEIYWDVVGAPGVFEVINVPVFNAPYRHKYPTLITAQTYTIRMVAYSGDICFSNRTQTVTVNAAPRTQFLPMPNVCFDAAPFQITQASETGGVPGTAFYSGPGVSVTGMFTPSSVVPGSTNTIKYLYVATVGGCRDSVTQTITVWDTASARITVAPITCEKNAIAFSSGTSTIPASAGTITGWNWNFGDPGSGPLNTSTAANPSHNYNTWGTYNVTLQVNTSNGCRSTIRTIPVQVNPLPLPDFTTPPSSCLPSASVVFNNTTTMPDGSTPSGYLWNFGDPGSGALNTSTVASPTHIYNTTGPFSVSLQVTSNNSCINTITKPLTTVHPQPLASFDVDKIDVCIGGSLTFTNTSNPMDGVTTQYNWNLDNGDTRSIPTFTYTYPTTGVYNVSLFIFNSHGCRSTTATRAVSVNPFPAANAGPDKFMLEGGQVELTPVLVTNMPVSYSWTPVTFLSNANISNPIATPPDDITYTLKVTSDKGCSTTDQVFIKVLKKPAIPNIFSPNGDGVHDTWVIQYLESYPGCTVDIYNRYGQHIYHSEGYTKPWDGTVNGKQVPVGTYYYIVNPKNGRTQLSGYVDVIR